MLKKFSFYFLAIIEILLFIATVGFAEGGSIGFLFTLPIMLFIGLLMTRYTLDDI